MTLTGIVIGLFAFVVMGIFHPIVIKGEYYFSEKIWPVFLIAGLVFLALSVVMNALIPSSFFAILGFTCLWSIGELKEQRKRVAKGWFSANPNRKGH